MTTRTLQLDFPKKTINFFLGLALLLICISGALQALAIKKINSNIEQNRSLLVIKDNLGDLRSALDMNLKMAVYIGRSSFENNYQAAYEGIDDQFEQLAKGYQNQEEKIDLLNAQAKLKSLNELNENIFLQVRNKNKGNGVALLESLEYEVENNAFNEALQKVERIVDRRIEKLSLSVARTLEGNLFFTMLLLVLICTLAYATIRLFKLWTSELIKFNASLEGVIKERTLELEEAQKTARIGSWSFDFKTHDQVWSSEHYRIFEIPEPQPSEKLFQLYRDKIHPDDLIALDQQLDETRKTGKRFVYNHRVFLDNGKRIKYVQGIGRCIYDQDGNPTKLVGTCQDISDQEIAKRNLENERFKASHNAKLASIGELAAGVGHEINNPLAIVNGNIDLIVRDLAKKDLLDEKTLGRFEKCRTASGRISNIVSGLRTFARSDTNYYGPFDLQKSTDQTVLLVKEIYEKSGITMKLDLPSHEVLINGNQGRVQQAIMNLLSNARDAISGRAQKEISVSLKVNGAVASLRIMDTGSGIPEEIKHKIFDAFFTTKGVGQGTGIGLSLTSSIMKEHGGEIKCESSKFGTEFELQFPLAQEKDVTDFHQQQQQQQQHKQLQQQQLAKSVLIVEDEIDLRDILRSNLEDLGCKVEEAENGKVALEKIRNGTYDFIFTDLQMPVMSGFQLLREVHGLNLKPRPVLIAVTGGITTNFDKNSSDELSSLVDDSLLKPYNKLQLIQVFVKAREKSRVA